MIEVHGRRRPRRPTDTGIAGGSGGSAPWVSAEMSHDAPSLVAGMTPGYSPATGDLARNLALGPLLDLLGQLRDNPEQVAHDAEVRELEDRCLGILVDHHDGLGSQHAGPVLDRPGDAHRHVQLRRDGLPGLADLELVRVPARVGGRAGRPDGGAQRVGQLLDQREVLRVAHPAAAGDHDRRLGELRPLAATSLTATVTFSSCAAPGDGAGSGAIAFGRTATIGIPARTRDCTMMAPPKIDCSATSPSSRPTASVSTPDPVLTASRPAISRPSAVLATSTAAGDFSATSAASSSALGATT